MNSRSGFAIVPRQYSIRGQNGASGYAANGNLLNYTDSVNGTWSNIGYDSLNRLSAATQSPVGGAAQSYCWTYDSFGNRTTQATSNQPFANAPGATTCQVASGATLLGNAWTSYSVNGVDPGNNRIVATAAGSYQPDAAGNIISDGVNGYVYDGEGRICAMYDRTFGGMTQYIYDAEGTRVAKGTISAWTCDTTQNGFALTNTYVIGPSGEQITETDGQGNWVHTNVFAAGQLIATYGYTDNSHAATDTYFALSDWLGTKRAVVSAGGCGTGYIGLPYGEGLTATNLPGFTQCPDATEHHFTGKERDTESGNDYFGARYYASSMGRFMSPDWSAKEEPVPYAKLDDPQSLNLYAYVRNNPLAKPDLDGHGCPPDCSTQAPAPGGAANPQNSQFLQTVKAELAGTVEMGKEAFSMLSALPYVGPLFGADSAAVSAIQGNTGEATTTSALAAIPAGGELGAGGRALELAGTMGKTADYVTIAVTKTAEGVDVVSSSEKAVRPAVQAALQPGEVAVRGAGHAEVTGVNGARQIGLTPTGVGASRGICPSCADFLRGAGVAALSALKQIF
jgi:RHS repeat-associated protein